MHKEARALRGLLLGRVNQVIALYRGASIRWLISRRVRGNKSREDVVDVVEAIERSRPRAILIEGAIELAFAHCCRRITRIIRKYARDRVELAPELVVCDHARVHVQDNFLGCDSIPQRNRGSRS